jgi:cysteine desulfurase
MKNDSLHLPIYMDYSATTPVDPRVVDKMIPYLREQFGNPASRSHPYGWDAERAVEEAREEVARLVNCDAREIVWTSGATESDNLALKGAAHFYKTKGRHLITVKTEHKAVLDTMRELERQGFEVTYLDVLENGLLDIEVFKAALRPDTILASVMMVNNETGVIQDIAVLASIARAAGALFHSDAAQAAGKIPLDVAATGIDLLSLSGHKIYGPKGVGALYVRRRPRVRLAPLFSGGGQERGLRSGTLPVPLVVGLGEAARLAGAEMADDTARIAGFRDRLWTELRRAIPGVALNGHATARVAGNLNLTFPDRSAADLMRACPDLCVSTGSACSSAELEPSYVLTAMGLDAARAARTLRVGIGRFTSAADTDFAAAALAAAHARQVPVHAEDDFHPA